MSKSLIRSIKNVTNGYTVNQVKVRNATSNDAWGPSSTDMNEIAQATFDSSAILEIMDMIERRLNDKGKNWRHVMKALVLLDYCLHVGSEDVVRWAKDNYYIIKTLREFQYIDEEGKDQGANVRSKAKDLASLLSDDERIRTERANRNMMREKMSHPGDSMFQGSYGRSSERPPRRIPVQSDYDNDEDFQRALEESRQTAAEEDARRRERETIPGEDEDIARALKISAEEALKAQQKEYLDVQNSNLLFNDVAPAQPQHGQTNNLFFSEFSPSNPGQQQYQFNNTNGKNGNNGDLLVDIFGAPQSAYSNPHMGQPAEQNPYAQHLFPQDTAQQFYPKTSNSPFAASTQYPQNTSSPFTSIQNPSPFYSQPTGQPTGQSPFAFSQPAQTAPLQQQSTGYQLFQRPQQTQSTFATTSPFDPTPQHSMPTGALQSAYRTSPFQNSTSASALPASDRYNTQQSYDSVGWLSGSNAAALPDSFPDSTRRSNNPFSKTATSKPGQVANSNDMSLL